MILRILLLLALLIPAPALAKGGMVSAADPRAAEAGRKMLRAGGTAADAAMAMMLALMVVEPQSSGIGGGGFMVYQDGAKGLSTYDGREAAPAAAGPGWFFGPDGKPMSKGDAIPGGRSVGVPGNMRLMALVHRDHGKLPWARLFRPAIRLARDGFLIMPRLNKAAGSDRHLDGWARSYLLNPDGTAKPVGTRLKNPELAKFLTQLAARGPDSFYVGPSARAIVATVNGAARNPSKMTLGDLAAYDARERPPVCGMYRVWRVCGMGPPSSGGVAVLQILKQLEPFDMNGLGVKDARAWHLFAESERLAYADRARYLADADHQPVPVAGLTDPAYIAARAKLIAIDRTLARAEPGLPAGAPERRTAPQSEVPATTHFVAVDGKGGVATMTSTVEGPFGSGLTVNGFFLNNELTDFDLAPVDNGFLVANRVEGGKRPRSSMAPTIVYAPDGSVRVAIGAAGGQTIIAQVAKALVGVLDFGLPVQDAIALPLVYAPGDTVVLEAGADWLDAPLKALGHRTGTAAMPLKANGIERVDGRLRGGADPRSEGVVLAE